MYEDLVKSLKICGTPALINEKCITFHDGCCEAEPVCMYELMRKAADAIEELSRDLDCMNDANIALYGALPKWIPVTERLPEERINPNTRDFEYVLCATIWGDVRPFKYGTQIGQRVAHFWNGAGYVDAYVTHWMQLPAPPVDTDKQP